MSSLSAYSRWIKAAAAAFDLLHLGWTPHSPRCRVQPGKTKVWVPEGLCPRGCEDWWEPGGLRVLGAPQGSETPLAALGELGAAVGSSDWVGDFLKQAFEGYRTFTSRVVAATLTADRHWSRAQAGVNLKPMRVTIVATGSRETGITTGK